MAAAREFALTFEASPAGGGLAAKLLRRQDARPAPARPPQPWHVASGAISLATRLGLSKHFASGARSQRHISVQTLLTDISGRYCPRKSTVFGLEGDFRLHGAPLQGRGGRSAAAFGGLNMSPSGREEPMRHNATTQSPGESWAIPASAATLLVLPGFAGIFSTCTRVRFSSKAGHSRRCLFWHWH